MQNVELPTVRTFINCTFYNVAVHKAVSNNSVTIQLPHTIGTQILDRFLLNPPLTILNGLGMEPRIDVLQE